MTLKSIEKGKWYKTKAGVGVCIDATTKWRPPAVKFRIVYPFPREALMPPREVFEETVAPPEGATKPPPEWG
jgi:hypothetical protein